MMVSNLATNGRSQIVQVETRVRLSVGGGLSPFILETTWSIRLAGRQMSKALPPVSEVKKNLPLARITRLFTHATPIDKWNLKMNFKKVCDLPHLFYKEKSRDGNWSFQPSSLPHPLKVPRPDSQSKRMRGGPALCGGSPSLVRLCGRDVTLIFTLKRSVLVGKRQYHPGLPKPAIPCKQDIPGKVRTGQTALFAIQVLYRPPTRSPGTIKWCQGFFASVKK